MKVVGRLEFWENFFLDSTEIGDRLGHTYLNNAVLVAVFTKNSFVVQLLWYSKISLQHNCQGV